jgi:hypothetical protein
MVVACAAMWAVRPSRHPWWQIALLGFAFVTILWMWRLVPLGCVAAAPLLAGAIQDGVGSRREALTRRERSTVAVGACLMTMVAAIIVASPWASTAQAYPGPLRTIARALDSMPAGTVVMNDFGISGWLLHEQPNIVPVADLRGEIYSRAHLIAYRDALAARPGWRDFVQTTGARVALLDRDSALAEALSHEADWTVIERSGPFLLLSRGANVPDAGRAETNGRPAGGRPRPGPVHGQVGPLGEVLAQQSVGVLVGAALPR